MFQLQCPLGHILEIGNEHLGQRLMCPMCEAVIHASPPRPGELPTAKYEVACEKGHILRVKQKYLGKEIRCPSCQVLVSMKPGMMLTSQGITLSVAKPELFKKKARASTKGPATPHRKPQAVPPKREQDREFPPTRQTSRIPPPPVVENAGDTDDQVPMQPEVMEEDACATDIPAETPKAHTITPVTIPDEDFEFEVVDTQFNMELKESGIEPIASRPSTKKVKVKSSPTPPVRTPPPPVEKTPAPDAPPVPTGLHNLSDSEMIKVNLAALSASDLEGPNSRKIQLNCPNGHLLELESQYRGMHIQCPLCQVIFQMQPS